MKNKCQKKSIIWLIGIMTLMITISLAVLTSCSSKQSMRMSTVTIEKNENSIPVDGPAIHNEKNGITKYLGLVGLNKKELIKVMNEEPTSNNEGGLDFKKSGIRVWFDNKSHTMVEQIFILKKDINLNGAKIGDKITSFEKAFGNPVSNKNGDIHFKYKNIVISVIYDTNTQKTYGVYILNNDF